MKSAQLWLQPTSLRNLVSRHDLVKAKYQVEILEDICKTIAITTVIVVCCIVLLSVSALCCFGGFLVAALTPQKYPIAEVKLDNNQIINVWYETDIQHFAGPHYYEITQDNKVIVPATEIGTFEFSRGPDDIQVAFAQDKTLVCIYDSKREYGLLILYNTQTGEAWPGASRSGDWKIHYAQLRTENPNLPEVEHLR